jgi:hypothetical protein
MPFSPIPGVVKKPLSRKCKEIERRSRIHPGLSRSEIAANKLNETNIVISG